MSETFEIYPIVVITENQSTEVQPNSPKEELQNIRLSYRLNGRNYLQWSQVEKTFLKGKRKLSHLMGIKPAQNDPTFVKRDGEDSMIMSWLWNLMLLKVYSMIQAEESRKDVMLESQLLEGSTMGSTKTSEEGIKRDAERQGSTIKTVKNESTGGNPNSISFWDPMMDRVSRRLDGWKRAFLSLGFGKISLRNQTLLRKWLWRYPKESFTLWHQVILSIYGTHPNGWDAYNIVRWSHLCLWKTIAHMLHIFSTHTRFVVGDGTRIRFWEDLWWGINLFAYNFQDCSESPQQKPSYFRYPGVHLSPSVPDAKAWVPSSSRASQGSSETIDHLFLHCPITLGLWHTIFFLGGDGLGSASLTGYQFAHFRVGSTRRRASIPSLMQVQESNLQSGIETPPPINDLDVP
ncbi:hypothetical protein CK203_019739 [Vitis vinifera]|uniref:Retrotransposon Copia-like N-terminal domain-containing protein n=1 Tax=Vitis vinifera TaxID=29760 RepID=A0A438JQQ6_VITVI|nr:hypothetical protein CK203_019739 [Vitis vinifera]